MAKKTPTPRTKAERPNLGPDVAFKADKADPKPKTPKAAKSPPKPGTAVVKADPKGGDLAVKEMTKTQKKALLKECEQEVTAAKEAIIDAGARYFVAGAKIAQVRDTKSYKETHERFDEYCREKLGLTPQAVNAWIRGAAEKSIIEQSLKGTGLPAPANVTQTEALRLVPAADRPKVWKEAVAKAGGKQPSTRQVAKTAKEHKASKSRDSVPEATKPEGLRVVNDPNDDRESIHRASVDDAYLAQFDSKRNQLSESSRAIFDRQALRYNELKMSPEFVELQKFVSKELGIKATAGPGEPLGPFDLIVLTFLLAPGPVFWEVCGACKGKGVGANGPCTVCQMNGFHIPAATNGKEEKKIAK